MKTRNWTRKFEVEVDYSRTIKEGLKVIGCGDWWLEEELKEFYTSKRECKEKKNFVYMSRADLNTKQILEEFKSKGLRLPDIWEAISFFENHSQCRFLLLEPLGNRKKGYRSYYLNFHGYAGTINCPFTDYHNNQEREYWNDSARFLGIEDL